MIINIQILRCNVLSGVWLDQAKGGGACKYGLVFYMMDVLWDGETAVRRSSIILSVVF
jgi:hypothetical protein